MLLDWAPASDDSEVTAYRVYRDGQALATLTGGTLRFVDAPLPAPAVYTYTVTAFDVVGHESAPADAVPAQVRLGPAGPLPVEQQQAPVPAAPVTYAATLRRYPYLTDVVGPYATVNWATDRSATIGSLRWGQVGTESCTAHTAAATRTALTINSVTEYQWSCRSRSPPAPSTAIASTWAAPTCWAAMRRPQFWTQVPAGSTEPFSFAVFGD